MLSLVRNVSRGAHRQMTTVGARRQMTTVKSQTQQLVEQLQIFEISIARKINNDALVRANIKEVQANIKKDKASTVSVLTGGITGAVVGTLACVMGFMLYDGHINGERLRNERDPNRSFLKRLG